MNYTSGGHMCAPCVEAESSKDSARVKYCDAKLGVKLEKKDRQIVEILLSEINTLTTKNQHLPDNVKTRTNNLQIINNID